MAGSIGGITCTRVVGDPRIQTQQINTWRIAGIDGIGVHVLGRGTEPTTWRAIYYGTNPGSQTWYDSLCALQGQIVNVVNELGQTANDQLVISVSQPNRRTAYNLAGVTTRIEVNIQTLST